MSKQGKSTATPSLMRIANPHKSKPAYLLPIANREEAALLLELLQKSAVPAPVAHVMAALWGKAQSCANYFGPADGGNAP
jgi:hypothetical protein